MITNPRKVLLEQERERALYLRGLSEEEAIGLLESLLTSGLLEEFTFSDHQPMALAMSIQNARRKL